MSNFRTKTTALILAVGLIGESVSSSGAEARPCVQTLRSQNSKTATLLCNEEALTQGLVVGYTATDRIAPVKSASRWRKGARTRRRNVKGRFAFERGGSPEDVLRETLTRYPDAWILPSTYYQEVKPDVTLDTTKADFRANAEKGFMERRPNSAANQEYEYKLTELGVAAAQAAESLDAVMKMTAQQRIDMWEFFFDFLAPPKWFSGRWFTFLFSFHSTIDAASHRFLEMFTQDKPRFDALLKEWIDQQETPTIGVIHDRILSERLRIQEKLTEPIQKTLSQTKNDLSGTLSTIDWLRNPANTMAHDLGRIPFEKWDLDTPNNGGSFGHLIEIILNAYGFRNSGIGYERRMLSKSSWVTAPPRSVELLVQSRSPSVSTEEESARRRLKRVRNEVRSITVMQKTLAGMDLEGKDLLEVGFRVLNAFGFRTARQGISWTAEIVPPIVQDLPGFMGSYQQAMRGFETGAAEARLLEEETNRILILLEEALRHRRAHGDAGSARLLSVRGPAYQNPSGLLREYAHQDDAAREHMILELIGDRAVLSRWSFRARRRIERLLIQCIAMDFAQEMQPGTVARALTIGRLSPSLKRKLLKRLGRMTADSVIFDLLDDPRRWALEKARSKLEEARSLSDAYQHVLKRLEPGMAVDPLPPADMAEFERIEEQRRLSQAG